MPGHGSSAYPITINGVGFHLWRERGRPAISSSAIGSTDPGFPTATAGVLGQFGSGDVSQLAQARDVPRIWDDFAGGGGYSRRMPSVPNGYAWCLGDARWPRGFMPAGELVEVGLPAASGPSIPYDSFDAPESAAIIMLAGRQAYAVGMGGAPAGLAGLFNPGDIATSAVRYGTKTYIAVTGGGIRGMWSWDHAAPGFGHSATASRQWLTSLYWVVGGVGANRIIGTDENDRIRVWPAFPPTPGDPMNEDDWGAPYQVGNGDVTTTHLVASSDHVYVVKSDGIYDLDGRGYAPNLTPWWRQAMDPANGLTACVQGQYVYGSTVQGLDRMRLGSGPDRGMAEWCHPGIGLPNETPIFGRVRAVCPVFDEIAGAVCNGTDSYICIGRPRDHVGVQGGVGPILWHMALAKIPNVLVTYMKVHTFGAPGTVGASPWLFIGGVDITSGAATTPKLFRLALPKASAAYQAFTQPELYSFWGDYPFATTASITLPTDDWGDPASHKVLRRFDLQADNLGGEIQAALYASADGDPLTLQDVSSTSPRDTLFPTDELTTGYQIGTRVDLQGTRAVPPVLRALKARAEVNVEVTEQRVYKILLGQLTEGANRARDRRDPGVLWAQLWALQAEGPVPMRDQHGHDLSVKVEPGMSYEERELPGGTGWVMVATVTVSVLSRPGYWDISLWNTDSTWSA